MTTWGTTATDPADKILSGGGFFPEISTAEFRKEYRIPAEMPVELIESALVLAISRVRERLKLFFLRQTAAGYATLDEVPQVNGEKSELWRRAVSCEAKADILRETPTVDRKPAAENAAKTAPETEYSYRTLAARAIRQIEERGGISGTVI